LAELANAPAPDVVDESERRWSYVVAGVVVFGTLMDAERNEERHRGIVESIPAPLSGRRNGVLAREHAREGGRRHFHKQFK